jgi:hypothetical protein
MGMETGRMVDGLKKWTIQVELFHASRKVSRCLGGCFYTNVDLEHCDY